MRRLFSVLVVMILLISSFSISISANTTTVTNAELLNKLDILRGNGVDYQLGAQLRRSEAAAFIVRLVGMDDEVVNNKGKYLQIDYSDVASHEWYAPYVGYCSQVGIISGFEDGTFRPDEYVSEKAFLKMLMTAVGYEYNVDFVWTTVYQSAYNLKIVLDQSYETKTEDNYEYLRGNVVDALYSTLQLDRKDKSAKMVDYFIDEGVITLEELSKYGFDEVDINTSIDTIEQLSDSSIEVTFSESIKELSLQNVTVIKLDNKEEITVDRVLLGEYGDSYHIIFVGNLVPDRSYELRISSIEDAKGNISTDIKDTFVVERSSSYQSNYFMLSKAEQISVTSIDVYFTHPVNNNVLSSEYYSVMSKGVTFADSEDNNIVVSLSDNDPYKVTIKIDDLNLDVGDEFELHVSGDAISQYGVDLNSGDGDFVRFVSIDDEEEIFALKGIVAESESVIELHFTHEVNKVIAEQVFSYYITEEDGTPIAITESLVVGDGEIVRLTVDEILQDNEDYNIMINNINDVTRAHSITEKVYDFEVDYEEVEDIEIVDVDVIDTNAVKVVFSRDIDPVSASNVELYSVHGKTNLAYNAEPVAVEYNGYVDKRSVTLHLPINRDMDKNDKYEIRIDDEFKDAQGNEQKSNIIDSFVCDKSDVMPTFVSNAYVVGENTIRLEFSKAIALDVPNVLNTNYKLTYTLNGTEYNLTPISASYIDSNTMILKFGNLLSNVASYIDFTELKDLSGNVTYGNDDDYEEKVQW